MMGFSDEQRRALEAKLNPKNVHVRTEGERELSYIEGWHAVAEANRVFGFEGWDRETVSTTVVSQSVKGGLANCSYVARVRIRVRAGDHLIVREGSGAGHGVSIIPGEAHERALKEAETDATKRALSTFGNVFGLALYDREQKGVRKEAPRKDKPSPDKDGLVLTLSPGDLEMFRRPEGYCSAFRKVLQLITSGEELIGFWKANEETVIRLREAYPRLKTSKGVHYAQILGELYTQRLQELAQSHVHTAPANRNPLLGRSIDRPGPIDKTDLAIPTRRVVRDKEHLRYVAAQPCLICGRQPAQAHHLRFMQPRAMGRKVSDEWTVPLCAIHHRQLHDAGDEQRWWAERQVEPVKSGRGAVGGAERTGNWRTGRRPAGG